MMIFPETLSHAGELVLNQCPEVPMETPALGVQARLALHWLLWSEKGCDLMGSLFLLREGLWELVVTAEALF